MNSTQTSQAVLDELAKVELSQAELDLVNTLKGLQQEQNKRNLQRQIAIVQAELAAPVEEEKKPEPKPEEGAGGGRGRSRTPGRRRSRERRQHRRPGRSRSRRRRRDEEDTEEGRSRSRSRRSRSSHRDGSSNSSKYSLRRYLRGKSAKEIRYDELVEAMMAWAYDQDGWEVEDYRRYIGHTLYIAHKATSRIYVDKALVEYDSAIRREVEDYGLEEFAKGNHDCVMDHFTVENIMHKCRPGMPHFQQLTTLKYDIKLKQM